MDIFKIIILSFSSLIVLFILAKIMGNKEISQLSLFDYIVSITIGSIAAEMATALEPDFWQPLVAMIIYALVSFIISYFSCKNLKFRRFFAGKALTLYCDNKFYKQNLKKAKLDIDEFLMSCRINGYFNLNDIQTAFIEPNGKISFLPKSDKRPTQPSDFSIVPSPSSIPLNIILDGRVIDKNLKLSGKDYVWLQNELVKQGITDISIVFLGTFKAGNLQTWIIN